MGSLSHSQKKMGGGYKYTFNKFINRSSQRVCTERSVHFCHLGLSTNKGASGKYNDFWTFKEDCHLIATFSAIFVF